MKTTFIFSVAVAAIMASNNSLAAPQLLPFQGHLTAADGTALDGVAKVVQFKIYDAPVSGTAVWAGEVHKLSVNAGLVNTVLGTKTAFPVTYGPANGEKVMFSEPLYIEITIDADDNNTISAADPPLLPRQVILPAPFAQVAQSAETVEGVDLIVDASGHLDPSVIAAQSLPASALTRNNGITADQLAANSVGTSELAANSVTSEKLGTLSELDKPDGSQDGVVGVDASGAFQIRDQLGKMKNSFEVAPPGFGVLRTVGQEGSDNAVIGAVRSANPDHGALYLRNASSENRVLLYSGPREDAPNGYGILELRGNNGKTNVLLHSGSAGRDHGSIDVRDANGIIKAFMTVNVNGHGDIRVKSTNGSDNVILTRVGASGQSPNRGYLGIRDENNKTQAALYINGDGQGFLQAQVSTLPSDRRLKKNIETLTSCSSIVSDLRPKRYKWRSNDHTDVGFIAQDVQETIPEAVHELLQEPDATDESLASEPMLGLDYSRIMPYLVGAIQEQQSVIQRQTELLQSMEQRLQRIEAEASQAER